MAHNVANLQHYALKQRYGVKIAALRTRSRPDAYRWPLDARARTQAFEPRCKAIARF